MKTGAIEAALIAGGASVLIYGVLLAVFPNRLTAVNFLGRRIPSSTGAILLLFDGAYFAFAATARLANPTSLLSVMIILSLGFGGFGLVDDLLGDRSVGGLKGHLVQLLQHGKMTTGAMKVFGCSIAAFAVGILLHPHNVLLALFSGATIALSANAVNLVDTRPGRCLFFSAILVIAAVTLSNFRCSDDQKLAFLPPLFISIGLYAFDRCGMLMIGDAGSNLVGALVGLWWCIHTVWLIQVGYLLALVWFHWWTESHSVSKVIESTRWLRAADRLSGIRN